jgi:hypothetical protein
MSKQSSWIVLALSLVGCVATQKQSGEGQGESDPGDEDPGDEESSSSGDGSATQISATETTATTSPTDPTDGSSESGETTCSFICDTGEETGPAPDCDLWAQDCPEGEKCMPWANDGGNAWNSARCSPVDDDPGQAGDECTVEGSGVSGIDTCGIGLMCWNVNEENIGTCAAFCGGTEANPVCENPNESCVIANDGFLILCLPNCDPLLQDCNEGEACYPVNDAFACAPDASGTLGLYADPCEYINACDPGLFCANAEAVPNCAGSQGCCSNFCDLAAQDPNASCVGDGQECVTWYEEGQSPPGFEDIGACAIPQ